MPRVILHHFAQTQTDSLMGNFQLYVPGHRMNSTDITLAAQSISSFVKSISPRHQSQIVLYFPVLSDLEEYTSELKTLPVARIDRSIDVKPAPDMFLFLPSSEHGIEEAVAFGVPLISFNSRNLRRHLSHRSAILIDPAVKSPVRKFSKTIRSLYFDPGAQKMLRKNLSLSLQPEELYS